MKVQSFEHMRTVYGGNRDLEPDDLEERVILLAKYKSSVIIEGGYMEFDNLQKWIKQYIPTDSIENIYYGKTDYDYGFAEFFIAEKIHEVKLRRIVPNIYTIYPLSSLPGKNFKSNGYQFNDIAYNPADKDAIVYPVDKNS